MENIKFILAKPVWIKGRENEKNLILGFRAVFKVGETNDIILRIAGSSLYRIYLNNEFIGYGPARGPHDFYRVDEWKLDNRLIKNENLIAIEVAGYNINGYYLLAQSSFLQAEIVSNGKVFAYTGEENNFLPLILEERVKKVQRFSFQRPFIEVYKLKPVFDSWKKEIDYSGSLLPPHILAEKNLISRGVAYPRFLKRPVIKNISSGSIEINHNKTDFHKDRELTDIGKHILGYKEEELEYTVSIELQKIISHEEQNIIEPYNQKSLQLKERSYQIVDFGKNLSGFIGAKVSCKKETLLYMVFDEILSGNDVDFKRGFCVNCITYFLKPGVYELESFESNTCRYVKFIVINGECEINDIYLREYANPDVYESFFSSSLPEINLLYDAAKETFRQNSLDIFMDCPGRERAGWLCDSFFTARVAMDISGHTQIERNFIENFLLPPSFAHHPEGMLPMCYPAEHLDGRFIPNWAMWFVIELEEYLLRSGDIEMVMALKNKVIKLINYFSNFKNEDGLLENLEQWIFVEWSKANDFVQNVNYPTNMLYAATLEAAGRIYNIDEYIIEAGQMKNTIRKQSFDGEFFVDNAERIVSKLVVTNNKTEVCQYYAFFFGTATPEMYPELWNKLKHKFGPLRDTSKVYPDNHIANAFIGNYLRLELLSANNSAQLILGEVKDYFLYMANLTGTLWEHTDTRASCNHGFASHISHIFYRDILGLKKINYQDKEITLQFSDITLDWCEGRLPLQNDFIYLKWRKEGKNLIYEIIPPFGFKVNILPNDDLNIIQV